MLGSVRKICDAENKAVLDKDVSYIQDNQSGKRTRVYQHKGTYAYNIWIKKGPNKMQKGNESNQGVCTTHNKYDELEEEDVEEGEWRESGFTRLDAEFL